MTEAIDAKIKARLGEARRILITGHIRPDGDAVGSMLGLGLALEKAGKHVQMVLPAGLPHVFEHLKGSELVQRGITDFWGTFYQHRSSYNEH